MLYAIVKAAISGVLVLLVSETAKRNPAAGALIASLPLVSVLAVIWLWRDTGDTQRIATQLEATFFYVMATLPMFLAMPAMLRTGLGFWPSLGAACLLTFACYLAVVWVAARFGVAL